MKFEGQINETIFVSEILPERSYMFNQDLETGLSIIWNTSDKAHFMIDNEGFILKQDEVIFLTEYHKLDNFKFERMNVLQFNRPFHCVEKDDSDVGCKGLLFFGASQIPKIVIPEDKKKQFNLLWEVFIMEMEEMDHLKLEMLQGLLKRFLILCLRIYKNEHDHLPKDNVNVGLIREYNYLVEKYFKKYSKVSDYANLLNKSPKTLSNIFGKYLKKTPLQIINERRLLESKRLLKYSDKTVQEIAYDINFTDVQTFSRFFRSMTGESPSQYRSL
ncbi:MAG: AraC family transcriptional activator of pobA [Cyclobacteriaceae bacterium]|jgi:AraC family transcriptional activator of pobA